MSNVIKIFENNEFGSLRTLTDEHGRIMFCGKDVASALGYSNTKDAIRRHCRWGVKHDLPIWNTRPIFRRLKVGR